MNDHEGKSKKQKIDDLIFSVGMVIAIYFPFSMLAFAVDFFGAFSPPGPLEVLFVSLAFPLDALIGYVAYLRGRDFYLLEVNLFTYFITFLLYIFIIFWSVRGIRFLKKKG